LKVFSNRRRIWATLAVAERGAGYLSLVSPATADMQISLRVAGARRLPPDHPGHGLQLRQLTVVATGPGGRTALLRLNVYHD